MNPFAVLGAVFLLCGSIVGSAAAAGAGVPTDAGAGVDSAAASASNGAAADPAAVARAVDPPDALAGGSSAAAVANDSAVGPGPNVLTLPESEPNRTGFAAPEANLSAALSMRADGLDDRFRTLHVRERLAAFDSASAKRRYIREQMTAVENRVDALKDRQGDALFAHSERDIDTRQLLVRLARVDATAEELRNRANVIGSATAETPGISAESDARVVSLRLRALEGPVRDRVMTAVGGGGPANRIYVQTTGAGTGVALSTVADGTYLREAYDGSLRTYEDGNRVPISQLRDIVRRSYPRQMQTGTLASPPGAQESNIFLANVDHADGHLAALVDRGAGRVFKESQRVDLSRSLAGPAVNATASGLRVTVNRTYPGGALRVSVADARTGRPVEGSVKHPPNPRDTPVLLGATAASDGALWTTAPPGEEFLIQVFGDGGAATVSVDATAPPSVSDARRASGDPPATGNDSAVATPSNETTPVPAVDRPVRPPPAIRAAAN